MQQIMNITDLRNNLSSIVASVATGGKPLIIVRDSKPEVVLVPYETVEKDFREKEELWKFKFERLLSTGKKVGLDWAKRKKLNLGKMSEEDKYALVKKA